MTMRLGGCGGVYFYASAGELWVEVEKQDLNIRRNKTHLHALLLAPDRSVVETSRGHKDARHEESLVFRNAGSEGDVVFMPGIKPFSIEASGLSKSVKNLHKKSRAHRPALQ
ncbi:MAG: hypothetical protein GY845_27500 [Planctomycetes bacterium]|nr:hypothetical protein [Planctomycetota bacterium]